MNIPRENPNLLRTKVNELMMSRRQNNYAGTAVASVPSMAAVVEDLLAFKKSNFGYIVKPFDLILFKGDDPVGKLIQKIENKWVSHNNRKKNGKLWTHAGMIVDKTILPLDCMDDGKLYILESIFSGTVLGFTYSYVAPVDFPFINGKICHSGPQVREFVATCDEVECDVAISPLTDTERTKLYSRGLTAIQEKMLELYEKYNGYGYPFSVLPQMASASDGFYKVFTNVKKSFKSIGGVVIKCRKFIRKSSDKLLKRNRKPKSDAVFYDIDHEGEGNTTKKTKKKAVFCSQFTAKIYEAFELSGFEPGSAGKFTPIELNAAPAFEIEDYYVKHKKKLLIDKDGKTLLEIE